MEDVWISLEREIQEILRWNGVDVDENKRPGEAGLKDRGCWERQLEFGHIWGSNAET